MKKNSPKFISIIYIDISIYIKKNVSMMMCWEKLMYYIYTGTVSYTTFVSKLLELSIIHVSIIINMEYLIPSLLKLNRKV